MKKKLFQLFFLALLGMGAVLLKLQQAKPTMAFQYFNQWVRCYCTYKNGSPYGECYIIYTCYNCEVEDSADYPSDRSWCNFYS